MLLAISGQVDMIGAERYVRRNAQSDGRIYAGDLLDQDCVVDVAVAGAAQFLRKNCAEHTHVAQSAKNVEGKHLGFIPFHDMGLDLGLGKLPNGFAKLLLFLRVSEIHMGSEFRVFYRRAVDRS